MEWHEVIEHPSLKDLPFKIETNAEGYIMMTPATNKHYDYQFRIGELISRLKKDGEASGECSIQTSDGVKVADASWRSVEFLKKNKRDTPYMESPEVVVEVKSPSNSELEMQRKMSLYFEKGAKEVWFCNEEGYMRFFNPNGELGKSELFPEFPERIVLDFV